MDSKAYCALTARQIADGVKAKKFSAVEIAQAALERAHQLDPKLKAFVTILDELALSDSLGATAEPWPVVAQLVRRASFDVLAAYTDRVQLEPAEAAVIDRLTTLYNSLMREISLNGRSAWPKTAKPEFTMQPAQPNR